MTIDTICSGTDAQRNDDHVAVFHHAATTDILVIDGGTSVAARDHLGTAHGDVAWFVHAFTAALEPILASGQTQQQCVHAAIDRVREAFGRLPGFREMPLHAWPIAALSWLRIDGMSGGDHRRDATLYSLGDCKTLLRTSEDGCLDPDPFTNPQEHLLQAEIARLRAEGVHDATRRRQRMLPLLRARREFQNTTPTPSVLCLHPHGPFQPRIRRFGLAADAVVLLMTDGFYRLVEPYALYTDAQLVDACVRQGLPALLAALRHHEAGGETGAQAVKPADDASAVLWTGA